MDRNNSREAALPAAMARLEVSDGPDGLRLTLGGPWTVSHILDVDRRLRTMRFPRRGATVSIDLNEVEAFDTAGAWLVHRTARDLKRAGATVTIEGTKPHFETLLARVAENDHPAVRRPVGPPAIVAVLERAGRGLTEFTEAAIAIAGFLGLTLVVVGRTIVKPWRLRVIPLVHHIEQVGLNAVPIIALINFLVGAVIAYQGAAQLRMFGAEIFAVDLTSISVLREIGILLTAIMVAGRSGSAFAAEIGAMKVHQEVDAMRTLALDPMEMLVLPRIFALIAAMPLLTFIGDIAGLLGGALVCWAVLDISPPNFFVRLNEVTELTNFWVGIIKAPVFGALIAVIGCYEGLQVGGSAESVGQHTTKAVVEAIFIVVVADALFSIFFYEIGW